MTTLYEGAFAKLNLTLDVLGKREDGYHDLKSVMQTVSIRDDVEIDIETGEPWKLECSVEDITSQLSQLIRLTAPLFPELNLPPNSPLLFKVRQQGDFCFLRRRSPWGILISVPPGGCSLPLHRRMTKARMLFPSQHPGHTIYISSAF